MSDGMPGRVETSRATAAVERPVALVTGATRGIGRAIAIDLARTHRVIVGGRDPETVGALVTELGDAAPFAVDLADEAHVAAAVAGLADGAGADGIDVLVHSAGVIGPIAPVAASDRAEFRRILELNVVAVADLTARLLPALRARRGLVVAINSGAGHNAGPRSSVYAASKFALRAVTDSLRAEEAPNGVRVTSIHPGRVGTDMQRELRAAEGGEYEHERYLEPDSVAATVRVAVDLPPSASVHSLSVRPFG
ncbi:SDR family oxidoreductase [Pseudoclavibacter endophyticus]|uniref:SDR family oxidoreductase n=1 Tax=Pseudoclavibacter endophyticus TaxID=1778590 RepID=UPI001E58CC4D|nr:SDR family oxidoreductase [Pseudoclavibacter endophyticus]